MVQRLIPEIQKHHGCSILSARARKSTRCWFQHSLKKRSYLFQNRWFKRSLVCPKHRTTDQGNRILPFEHEECKKNRLNQDSCSTKAPWMFDSSRSSLTLLERSIFLSIVILSHF